MVILLNKIRMFLFGIKFEIPVGLFRSLVNRGDSFKLRIGGFKFLFWRMGGKVMEFRNKDC